MVDWVRPKQYFQRSFSGHAQPLVRYELQMKNVMCDLVCFRFHCVFKLFAPFLLAVLNEWVVLPRSISKLST